jgi:hypothetical protein
LQRHAAGVHVGPRLALLRHPDTCEGSARPSKYASMF